MPVPQDNTSWAGGAVLSRQSRPLYLARYAGLHQICRRSKQYSAPRSPGVRPVEPADPRQWPREAADRALCIRFAGLLAMRHFDGGSTDPVTIDDHRPRRYPNKLPREALLVVHWDTPGEWLIQRAGDRVANRPRRTTKVEFVAPTCPPRVPNHARPGMTPKRPTRVVGEGLAVLEL